MSEDIKSTDSHIIQYLDSHNLSAEIQPKAQQNLTQDNLQNLQEFRTTLQEEANIHSNIQKVQNVVQNAQISQQRQIQGDQIDHQSTQHQQPQQIHLQNYILAAVQSQQVGESEAKTQTEIVFEENHQCQLSARYYTELEGNTKLPSDHNEAEVNSNHDQQLTLNEVQNLQTEAQPNDYQPEIEHEYEQIPVQEYRQSDFFAEKEEANSQNSCFKFVGMEEENSVVRDQKFLVEIQKKFSVEQIVEVQTRPMALEQPKEKIERSVVQQNQADLSVKNNEVLEVKFTRSLVSDTMFKKSQTTITKIQQTISSALPKQINPSQIKRLQTKAVQKMEVSTVPPVQKVAESIKKEFKVQGREAERPNIEQPINRTLQTRNSADKVEKKAQNGIPQLITQHKQIQETVLNSKDQKQKMRLHQRIVQNITIETNAVQINPAPHNLKVSQNPQPNVKQLPKRLQQPTVKPQTNEVNPIQSYVKQLPKRPQNTRQRPQHIQYFQKVQSYVKDPPPKPLQQNPAQKANNLMKMRQVNQLKISEEEQVEKQHSRHQQQSVEQPQQPIKTGKKKKKHAQSNLERPKHPKQDALPPSRLDNNNIVPPQPAFNASKAPAIQNEPLERGHGNALNVLPNPLPPLPASQADSSQPVTNTFIIQQAQKQRMDSTYKIFIKYMVNYTKALNFYKSIVQNVYQELFRKKNQKRVLEATLMSYFQGHASLSNQFHEQCMKIFPVEVPGSNNPFGNLRLQLRRGFDELTYLRKGVAAQNQKMGKFVRGTSIPGISKALALFYDKITAQQRKFLQKRQLHATRQQMFYKVVAQVDKVFRQGVQGKYKKDILVEIARLINQEQGHRQILRNYGRAILPLRATYISAEHQLFQSLQKILNQFKNQSKLAYFVGRREFHHVEDLSGHIRQKSEFQELSPLTDTDYIKYVLELEQRKETNEYSNSHFQRFLELTYFDKLVGPIRSIYRGTITKSFPLTTPNEQLIHTISGNLVQFNRQMDHTLNFFVLRHISAKIINEGVVEFDEVLKGIIFDDYRTIRVKLADGDRAEELICYLDRTTETIVVG